MVKQKYDTPFEKFLRTNGLAGKEVAHFLDVSDAFISQLRQGKVDLPSDKMMKLKQSGNNWDLSMFPNKPETREHSLSEQDDQGKISPQFDKMLDALNEALKQNSRLIGIIEKMQKI